MSGGRKAGPRARRFLHAVIDAVRHNRQLRHPHAVTAKDRQAAERQAQRERGPAARQK